MAFSMWTSMPGPRVMTVTVRPGTAATAGENVAPAATTDDLLTPGATARASRTCWAGAAGATGDVPGRASSGAAPGRGTGGVPPGGAAGCATVCSPPGAESGARVGTGRCASGAAAA